MSTSPASRTPSTDRRTTPQGLSAGRLLFLAVSLGTVLTMAGGTLWAATAGRQADDGSDSLYKYLAMFTEVLGLVDRAYVEETDSDVLMAGALEGAVDALDPFSLYVPASRVESYGAAAEIGIRRSGLTLFKERGVAYVAGVEEGSPAAVAGLEVGDVVSTLGGQQTRPMPLFRLQEILAGPVGEEIELERIRLGVEETVRFTLAEYPSPSPRLRVEEGLAVLRIPSFSAGTASEVRAALGTLLAAADPAADPATADPAAEAGAVDLVGLEEPARLLIDLRGVVGGDPAAAYEVASAFVGGDLGALVKRGAEVDAFTNPGEPLWRGESLVVLVDRGTQGPAEILATVLKQVAEATLVGNRTFGHSGRASFVELSTGARLRITDAFYTGPDRAPIDDSLVPDVFVRPVFEPADLEDPEAAEEPADAVLERGLEVLREAGTEAAAPAAA